MRVFKFGGASVKDASGVINILSVLKHTGFSETLIVVSAMGKTTNALEEVVKNYFDGTGRYLKDLEKIKQNHYQIIAELFEQDSAQTKENINQLFEETIVFLNNNNSKDYSLIYDQVVSLGELVSTTIISNYMTFQGIENRWLDARKSIKTDNYYRDANLDWEATQKLILKAAYGNSTLISQGFIGSDSEGLTTTLGREGSDYSAAIFAYALDVESVTIWKDVPGVLNADPRVFKDTQLLRQISYREAIELAYYGASVIHPKTLQPLQRKEIPLYVRSFLNPEGPGTSVSKGKKLEPLIPCYILKPNQVLIRLSSLDFSFMVEDNISEIFALLYKFQMRVDLIQNSAISFSVCVNNKYGRLEELLQVLRSKFKVTFFENVHLYTVRHFDSEALKSIEAKKDKILLEQRAQETIQYVLEK